MEIAYYITAHGYGHGVRSMDIIRAINRLYPEVGVHIITGLPEPFLRSRLGRISSHNETSGLDACNWRHVRSFDVGMVQLDSIRVDVAATLSRALTLYDARERLLVDEIAFLKKMKIDTVVTDIPSLPLEAAARVGIPRVAVGNFSWDWIYSGYLTDDSRWSPVVEMFREHYSRADLLLRLPFHDEMEAFPKKEDLPLTARPGTPCRDKIAAITGCDPEKKWVMLSFTTLDLNEDALARIERIKDCEFLTVQPLEWNRSNIHVIAREQASFSDVLASSDMAISKPGFGILSDCVVNNKPLIYADRENFLEYPILEEAIRKYLKYVHIPAEDLYRGDFESSLIAVETAADPPQSLDADGDEIAARRIINLGRPPGDDNA